MALTIPMTPATDFHPKRKTVAFRTREMKMPWTGSRAFKVLNTQAVKLSGPATTATARSSAARRHAAWTGGHSRTAAWETWIHARESGHALIIVFGFWRRLVQVY